MMEQLTASKALAIPGQLPRHWRENAGDLIRFMQLYYEWLYRQSGMTPEEYKLLDETDSWFGVDIDKYQQTKRLRYLTAGDSDNKMAAMVQESNTRAPGAELDALGDEIDLDHDFSPFMTADGDLFEDSNGRVEESKIRNPGILEMWTKLYGGVPIFNAGGINTFDPALFVRLLKHLYDIKGTYKCTKLFFEIFFGEKVEIKTPKFSIAIIDGGFTPDKKDSVIRDDRYYQEFSYVIATSKDPSEYIDLFDSVYKQYLHPAGFACFIEHESSSYW